MRILLIAGEAPLPPLNGYRLWLSHVAGSLARRHEVCVAAFRGPDQHGEPPPGVELVTLELPSADSSSRAVAYLAATATRTPSWVGPLTAPMRDAIRDLRAEREFDVAHVTGIPLLRAADALDGIPTVVVALDAVHRNIEARAAIEQPPTSWLLGLQARFTRRFSARELPRFTTVVVTREDADALRELGADIDIEVIPNGVDASFFSPDPTVERTSGLLVFTGAMHWAPNVTAARFLAREVLPRIRAAGEDVKLAIVGRNPAPQVAALGSLPGVEVTGEVPDIRAWLRRAEVYVCPMVSGTGIKNKLLEAFAVGTPAVATPRSCHGMDVRSERELLVSDTPAGLAEAVVRLLRDAGLRDRLGQAGRRYVLERHDWSMVGDAYERVSRLAIARAGGHSSDPAERITAGA